MYFFGSYLRNKPKQDVLQVYIEMAASEVGGHWTGYTMCQLSSTNKEENYIFTAVSPDKETSGNTKQTSYNYH